MTPHYPPIGARIEQPLRLDAAAIRAGAAMVGDMNPLHHDDVVARASRFGELIASGAHTSALLAGLLSRGFGDEVREGSGCVGVDYRVQFVAPVRVGRPMRMEWLVAAHEPHRSGVLARLKGRIEDAETGTPAVIADMAVLYFT